jgi:hypothetical protein
MGWAVGWDSRTKRFRGYGVPAYCEEPGCPEKIDRGLAYACGGLDDGCGRFFCEGHLFYLNLEDHDEDCECGVDPDEDCNFCSQCVEGLEPYPLKPERRSWLKHVLSDSTWAQWRREEPKLAKEYRAQLKAMKE